jgi:hypothetical protein
MSRSFQPLAGQVSKQVIAYVMRTSKLFGHRLTRRYLLASLMGSFLLLAAALGVGAEPINFSSFGKDSNSKSGPDLSSHGPFDVDSSPDRGSTISATLLKINIRRRWRCTQYRFESRAQGTFGVFQHHREWLNRQPRRNLL